MTSATTWRAHARWFAKKAARRAVAAASAGARLGLPPGLPRGVHVLTYHRFGDPGRDPFCVRADHFAAQMAWLERSGLAVSLADVEAHLSGERPLRGAVLVTVDDGFESLAATALPILVRHRIPAVAFVPAGEIGTRSPDLPERRLGWDELARVAAAGVTIGSHSWTHRSLAVLRYDDRREELTRSRTVLEERLGRAVTSFAYPFGTVSDFNPTIARAVRDAGYTCAFTSCHGIVRPDADRFTLPRVKVEGGDAFWLFRALVRGALDAWRLVDETLWWAQARAR